MSKRYFQVRRKRRNELIMKALQFESASWIWEGINDIFEGYKIDTCQSSQDTVAEQEEDEEEQEMEELLDWELRMNECASLRVQDDFEQALCSAFMKMDSRIHICCGCRKRFIGERAKKQKQKIHQNERHNIKS